MTIHTGAKPCPATESAGQDWSSLDEASRNTAVAAICDRALEHLIADIQATTGSGQDLVSITLAAAAATVRAVGKTPPAGVSADIWREITFDTVRRYCFLDLPPRAIDGTTLTAGLEPGFMATAMGNLAAAARTLNGMARKSGLDQGAFLATAAAAHCIQMAGLVLERAGTEGWSADLAVTHLYGAFRATETLVREGIARGPAFPEVQGHA